MHTMSFEPHTGDIISFVRNLPEPTNGIFEHHNLLLLILFFVICFKAIAAVPAVGCLVLHAANKNTHLQIFLLGGLRYLFVTALFHKIFIKLIFKITKN